MAYFTCYNDWNTVDSCKGSKTSKATLLRIVQCAVFGLLQEDVEVQREKGKIPFVTEEFRESECEFEGENNK